MNTTTFKNDGKQGLGTMFTKVKACTVNILQCFPTEKAMKDGKQRASFTTFPMIETNKQKSKQSI